MDGLQRRSILEQGLAEAHKAALLPDDADLVIFGVKEGDHVGGGIAVRIDERWQFVSEATLNTESMQWGGKFLLVAKSRQR